MPQDHSSTPIAHEAFLPEDTGAFNAFSLDGLDDELFEQSPEPKLDGRSPELPELEDLLKKKRSHPREDQYRGFGRKTDNPT